MNRDKVAEENDANLTYDGGTDNGDDAVYAGMFIVSFIVGALIGAVIGVLGSIANQSFWTMGFPFSLLVLAAVYVGIAFPINYFERSLSRQGVSANVIFGLIFGSAVLYCVCYWLVHWFIIIIKDIFT